MTPSLLSCPPRFGTPRNPDRDTLGPEVGKIAVKLGMPLMPWQQHVADVAYEVGDDGHLFYGEIDITVPRQEGKTALAMAAKVFRCTKFGRQNVMYTAQSRNAAAKKFLHEHVYVLEHSPFNRARAFTVRRSNGSEAIEWRNGSRWAIDAPTTTAGHGDTLDHGDIDEAFAHIDDRVEVAMLPAMITRPSSQIWIYSTAGDAKSFYLYRKLLAGRKACEEGSADRIAYFEWSAADEADPADEATWTDCSPALGYTITLEALRAEWSRAQRKGVEGINLFRRAFLNQWPEVPVLDDLPGLWEVIPAEHWKACEDRQSAPVGTVAFAVDTTPDRAWSTISLAGTRADGLGHLEIVDHRAGNDWVEQRLRELIHRWSPVAVAIDPAGPAGSMLVGLEAIHGDLIRRPTAREHAQSAGELADAAKYATIRHRDQSELSAAVASARKRPLGDAWAWTRNAGAAPVSPLVGVTLARWALRSAHVEGPSVYEERGALIL
jgi:hypothetical protein